MRNRQDIVQELHAVTRLCGDTYSSAEVLGMVGRAADEIERLRAALKPFAEVARWAERNGHDLLNGWDMLLRQPDGGFAGHLQAQSPDFIAASAALGNQQPSEEK